MTRAEQLELAAIPTIACGAWLISSALPRQASLGRLCLAASVLLLLQGLVRDLWLLAQQKRSAQHGPQKQARCMCVESSIGVSGVAFGLVVVSTGFDQSVNMPVGAWSALVILVMGVGFVIKDYVIETRPLRVRRDKDHINIVFTWKS